MANVRSADFAGFGILGVVEMIQVLEFVFSSFWHWIGTVVLVMATGTLTGGLFRFNVSTNLKDRK